IRWSQKCEALEEKIKNLKGNLCLATAYVGLLGPFTGTTRLACLTRWELELSKTHLSFDKEFTIKNIFSDPLELRDWNIHGLPSDDVSISNGIITTKSVSWPLLIDPQLQANRWIKSIEGSLGVKIIQLSDKNWLKIFEECIIMGYPALIENVEEQLEHQLLLFLQQTTNRSLGVKKIFIGDREVHLHPDFRLYITTEYTNPHFLPHITVCTSLINFTVTMDGLKQQLLSRVVAIESPELEQKNDILVVAMAKDSKALVHL
ncbi:hypothetical protein IE077_001320, partial [Cardiosporidium cionae]